MEIPVRMYKFGKTVFQDILERFDENLHTAKEWRAIPLSRDYEVKALWSKWVSREEANEAERWFARAYPKNFHCPVQYNGISECRDWTPKESYAFYKALEKRFPKSPEYQTEIQALRESKTLEKTHRKIYYVMLTKKQI